MKIWIPILLVTIALAGCTTLTLGEEEKIAELESLGVDPQSEGSRSPSSAAGWNILFGLGDLAVNGQPGSFAANCMFWPLSIFWSPFTGYHQAKVLNRKTTVDYYWNTKEGCERLAGIRAGTVDPMSMSPRRLKIEKEKAEEREKVHDGNNRYWRKTRKEKAGQGDSDWPDP